MFNLEKDKFQVLDCRLEVKKSVTILGFKLTYLDYTFARFPL